MPVLGFDCEWVTRGSSRRPVALLQLATLDGLCVLIRLCRLSQIPDDLKVNYIMVFFSHATVTERRTAIADEISEISSTAEENDL